MEAIQGQRPRSLDWRRASALLYGDWGTSKAYVLGLAFATAGGFGSFPVILAVCVLTALVGVNYMIICRCFPDGGGVYSAARKHNRILAVVGALLLMADLTVTAALSAWAALSYLGVPQKYVMVCSVVLILAIGVLNFFGPKHSGSLAMIFALPTAVVVGLIILMAVPHLTFHNLEPLPNDWGHLWVAFVGVILALSGVEAIANMTGILKPDRNSTPDQPRVGRTAFKAILPVALEVSIGTALLGWAMLSLPKGFRPEMLERKEDMIRFVAEQYATMNFGVPAGHIIGFIVGVVFALLLLSAVNTAVATMIGVLFMTAQDGEMPERFVRLNPHGIPVIPLIISIGLPIIVLFVADDFEALAGLYAIGVVGAICVNLGACSFNLGLPVRWYERGLLFCTFVLLTGVELTLAKTKPDALFFVTCVLLSGLALRAFSQRRSGITTISLPTSVAQAVSPEAVALVRRPVEDTQRILVCVRGVTPLLRFAFDEAKLRGATLYVLYVREIAVIYQGTGPGIEKISWKDDPEAKAILSTAIEIGREKDVPTIPVFATSTHAPGIIVDTAATLGADFLMLGASNRGAMSKLLRGNVVREVAASLPDSISLVIYG